MGTGTCGDAPRTAVSWCAYGRLWAVSLWAALRLLLGRIILTGRILMRRSVGGHRGAGAAGGAGAAAGRAAAGRNGGDRGRQV